MKGINGIKERLFELRKAFHQKHVLIIKYYKLFKYLYILLHFYVVRSKWSLSTKLLLLGMNCTMDFRLNLRLSREIQM